MDAWNGPETRGLKATVFQPVQAADGPNPYRSVAGLQDLLHQILAVRSRKRIVPRVSIGVDRDQPRTSGPDAMLAVLRDRMNRNRSKSRALVYSPQPFALKDKQSIVRSDPDSPTIVLIHAAHKCLSKAIARRIDSKLVAAQTQETTALGPRPQTAVLAQRDAEDAVDRQRLRHSPPIHLDARPIEPRQPARRPDPQHALAGFGQRLNCIFRQSIRHPPDGARVLKRLRNRPLRKPRSRQNQCEQPPQRPRKVVSSPPVRARQPTDRRHI